LDASGFFPETCGIDFLPALLEDGEGRLETIE
jgi:hypothetical protein